MAAIRIINTSIVKEGVSGAGKAWTLREVTATKLDGEPIDLKLKTFEDLSGEVDVEFEKQEHEKYGVSYILKRKGGGGGSQPRQSQAASGLGEAVDLLRQNVEHLQNRVAALEGRLDAMTRESQTAVTTTAAPATTTDDDIPF